MRGRERSETERGTVLWDVRGRDREEFGGTDFYGSERHRSMGVSTERHREERVSEFNGRRSSGREGQREE